MAARILSLPASGATVIVRWPLAAKAAAICGVSISARMEATLKGICRSTK